MILVDANLLIYAVNLDAPHHERARRWLQDTLSSTTAVGLPWISLLAFVRITTRPGILASPVAVEEAIRFVDTWLDQPFVEVVLPGNGHWAILQHLLRDSGAAGNLTSDAHLAALAIEHGATICSADYDFQRFPRVEHINPLN
ncbi:MAG: type II toxin-antitoxin system VapC family toxin [Acidobacteria bacterium]|nr:type II toxin-antitoxin system VapC family toxin [Acidobacteriota bacterium]